ncbi:MAG: dephospho-CoA kinase [Moorellaceae bacterium]
MIIGLTGGIASGKSTVARILANLGAKVIDADKIAREIVEPGKPAWHEIRSTFGPHYFKPDGSIDRRALGNLIFSDATAREKLNAITHPLIAREISERIAAFRAQEPSQVIVVEAPLLVEAGMQNTVDEIWAVTAPEEVRLKRLMDRDNLSQEEALRRLKSQLPEQEKLKYAARIIDTGQDMAATVAQVKSLWEELRGRMKAS